MERGWSTPRRPPGQHAIGDCAGFSSGRGEQAALKYAPRGVLVVEA